MVSAITCPRCAVPMERRFGGRDPKKPIVFDRCAGCGGLWLDEFETPALGKPVAKLAFQTEEIAERWPYTRRFEACPRCGTRGPEGLRQVNLLDVVIEYCLRCRGIYFDAGEVEALIAAMTDVEQAKATGSYRAAPHVKRAIGARTFECSRCGVERSTTESCILPAGLVCGPCFYERDEAALEASAGAFFAAEFAVVVPRRIANGPIVPAEPVFSRLGVALGVLGFEYCAVCGRRPYDTECTH